MRFAYWTVASLGLLAIIASLAGGGSPWPGIAVAWLFVMAAEFNRLVDCLSKTPEERAAERSAKREEYQRRVQASRA